MATNLSIIDRQKTFLFQNTKMLRAVLPEGMDPNRIIAVALAAMQKNRDLAACTPESVLLSLMLSAQIGLDAGGTLGHAWLIPYKGQCTMQLGFRGMIELAVRSRVATSVMAEVVYKEDVFEYDRGTGEIHHPYSFDIDRSDNAIIGAYAIATLPSGEKIAEVMTRAEIEKRKAVAMTKNVWNKWFKEMCQKTVVKRLFMSGKVRIPSSSMLGEAVTIDNLAERGDDQRTQTRVPFEPVQAKNVTQKAPEIGETRQAVNPYDKPEVDMNASMNKGMQSPENKMQGPAPSNKEADPIERLIAVVKRKRISQENFKKAMIYYMGRACEPTDLDPQELESLIKFLDTETAEDKEAYR